MAQSWRHVAGAGCRLVPCVLVLAICGLAGRTALAQEPVTAGIYWDAAHTQTAIEVESIPGLVTCYVILDGMIDPAGVVAWELGLDLRRRASVVSTQYAGQAINAASPPAFVVGLAEPILPVGGHLLLATCEFVVTDRRPIEVLMGPVVRPSLPQSMAYIAAGDPGLLLPVVTATGLPVVATINLDHPDFEYSAEALDFDTCALGTTTTREVSLTNRGVVATTLEPALGDGCEGFALVGAGGPLVVAPGQTAPIRVSFTPQAVGSYDCTLVFRPDMSSVSLQGAGRMPVFRHWVTPSLDFGTLEVGTWRELTALVINTGEIPFVASPALLGCTEGVVIVSGGESRTLLPRQQLSTVVRFHSQVSDTLSCALGFGEGLDQVSLSGIGVYYPPAFAVTGHLNFGVVPLQGGAVRMVTVRNNGLGSFSLVPSLSGCGTGFIVNGGTAPVAVPPGQSRSVTVSYYPVSHAATACALDLGPVVGQIPITASTRNPFINIAVPTNVNFGTVVLGSLGERTLVVTNNGEVGVTVDPVLVGCDPALTLVAGGFAGYLLPGQSQTVTLRFIPSIAGDYACSVALGAGLPTVAVTATAAPALVNVSVSPEALVFPPLTPGSTASAVVTLRNNGLPSIQLSVALAAPDGPFTITAGAGAVLLPSSGEHRVTVRFAPTEPGAQSTGLLLGAAVPIVPVTGVGTVSDETCLILPGQLDFGTLPFTVPAVRAFMVSNTGYDPLNVAPTSNSPHFWVDGTSFTLAPGVSRQIAVRFDPPAVGAFEATISLGSAACDDLVCTGWAEDPIPPDGNRLGIYFDPGYTTSTMELEPGQPATGYLVLRNAVSQAGLLGWECAVKLLGDGELINWTFEGEALNIGLAPDLVVGLGGPPLPWATDIRLASFRFQMVAHNTQLLFFVGPTRVPALPGQMAWIDGESRLWPMRPRDGQTVVATVNSSALVGLMAPTPVGEVVGRRVNLLWPAPAVEGGVCHVYRRAADAAAVRLTEAPLVVGTESLRYTDSPAGYNSGTTLNYSYSIEVAGLERARSPELEITLGGVPPVGNRLLPNVPNPFNPQTEIRFELEAPVAVQVAIYDVTGRRIGILQEGFLAAGPHARIWQGRDQNGREVASGAYYVRLVVNGQVDHRKILLLR